MPKYYSCGYGDLNGVRAGTRAHAVSIASSHAEAPQKLDYYCGQFVAVFPVRKGDKAHDDEQMALATEFCKFLNERDEYLQQAAKGFTMASRMTGQ